MAKYPDRLLTDDETIVVEFHPHWRVLLLPILWLVLTVGAVLAALQVPEPPTWLVPAVALLSAVFLLGLGVPPFIQRQFTLYVLTSERIVVRTGVLTRNSREIPLESISNVVFNQSVIERMLGYGDVLLESSGETSTTQLDDVPDPEGFQSQVYAVREQRSMHFSRGGGGPAAPRDSTSRLAELADLHDRGKLTDEEYQAEKAKLLGEG